MIKRGFSVKIFLLVLLLIVSIFSTAAGDGNIIYTAETRAPMEVPAPGVERNSEKEEKEIIRFHVEANSNHPRDQEIKNIIAAEVLEAYKDRWKEVNSPEKLYREIKENKTDIKQLVEEIAKEKGVGYGASLMLTEKHFPARIYAGDFYPAGKYKALILSLGEGKGENWWCVLFPPFCYNIFLTQGEKEGSNSSENKEAGIDEKETDSRQEKEVSEEEKEVEKDLKFWLERFLP